VAREPLLAAGPEIAVGGLREAVDQVVRQAVVGLVSGLRILRDSPMAIEGESTLRGREGKHGGSPDDERAHDPASGKTHTRGGAAPGPTVPSHRGTGRRAEVQQLPSVVRLDATGLCAGVRRLHACNAGEPGHECWMTSAPTLPHALGSLALCACAAAAGAPRA